MVGRTKGVILLATAVAVMIIGAGAYVALTSGGGPSTNTNNPGGGDQDPGNKTDEPGTNTTVNVSFPVNISADQAKMELSVDYPGKANGSGYEYKWTQPYQFTVTTTPLGSYEGRVLTKMFAVKSGEIGAKCLLVYTGNRTVSWHFAEKQGTNHISGDLNSWTSNGTAPNEHTFTVVFNRTGDFQLFFQSFDLDTGEAISEPWSSGLLKVPVEGTLAIRTVGEGSYVTDENGTRFSVILNITNGWNVRYTVEANNLYISNGSEVVGANLTAMSFESQSLAVGQSTQFIAYFDITGEMTDLELEYRDPVSDQVIKVPLS